MSFLFFFFSFAATCDANLHKAKQNRTIRTDKQNLHTHFPKLFLDQTPPLVVAVVCIVYCDLATLLEKLSDRTIEPLHYIQTHHPCLGIMLYISKVIPRQLVQWAQHTTPHVC